MILTLTTTTPEDLSVLGGKGCGLVRLLRAGLPVPEAYCLPAQASLKDRGNLSPQTREGLENLWAKLTGGQSSKTLLAVRSSAVAEDLEGASFAGVYQTLLGVSSKDALLEAVQKCWAAFHDARARIYRDKKKIGHEEGIAVVIQRMLRPEAAGVLLTANPRRPFAKEVVVDASWGLGEAIVSGKIHPDHWVLERGSGKIREEHLGAKEIEIVWTDELVERPVAEERRVKFCLSKGQLALLSSLAAQVEEKIGPRQDLEWAIENDRLFVLQQRPITGLPPENPRNIWTRKFGDEYMADYAMPLSRDLLVKWISDDYLREMAELQGRDDLEGMEPMCSYHGYTYLSGAYIGKMLEAIPPGPRAEGVFDWFPPSWNKRIGEKPWKPRYALTMALAPLRDPRGPIQKNPEALEKHCGEISKRIAPKLAQDYAALSNPQWRVQFEEAYELGREHFRVIRWGMGYYNPLLHGMLQRLLAAWAGDQNGELYQALISGLPGTKTAQINHEVWELGLLARAEPDVLQTIRDSKAYNTAREPTKNAKFWGHFDSFLSRHGHRAATREIAQPRWRETPEVLFALVQAQVHPQTPPENPAAAEKEVVRRREEAQKNALRLAGHGPTGLLRRWFLGRLVETTQIYTNYRENQRYFLDYLLFHVRRLVLDQGRRLVAANVLGEPFDVFLLSGEEFWKLLDHPAPAVDLSARIEDRRREYLLWKNRLPATFLYDDVETEGELVEGDPGPDSSSKGTAGFGASRGRARGRVRVVSDLSGIASVEAGDILVTSNIDPGWTSVFPLLSGLITETGGILSHGAILAREYGIPAVTGVKNATRIYETGELLEIDGSNGRLERVPVTGSQ